MLSELNREPATGRLIESKMRFLERIIGGVDGLVEWIRDDAERLLHRWFYDYLDDILRIEDIDLREVLKIPGVRETLEEAWDKIRVEAVDYVLGRFADYIERKYGLEGIADRYLLCWVGPEFSCRLDKVRVLQDFEEAAVLPFRHVMEDIIDDLLDIILYSMAETERER
jgi:hypothetical protein